MTKEKKEKSEATKGVESSKEATEIKDSEDQTAPEKKSGKETVKAESKSEQELSGNKLLQNLKEEEARAETLLNDLKRLKADFENYKKRMVKEQTIFLKLANSELIAKLLPVIDNLERALASAEEHENEKTIKEGIEMVNNQLLDILANEGMEIINPVGEEFNPEEHEAVLQIESKEHPEETVVEVLQKGYRLKGKILRPARVKVSK